MLDGIVDLNMKEFYELDWFASLYNRLTCRVTLCDNKMGPGHICDKIGYWPSLCPIGLHWNLLVRTSYYTA
jgi:hypothetical protein